jgi:hypothetical protein
MKKIILKYVLRKVLYYLNSYRLSNIKQMDIQEWHSNNDACQYIYRHIVFDLK